MVAIASNLKTMNERARIFNQSGKPGVICSMTFEYFFDIERL